MQCVDVFGTPGVAGAGIHGPALRLAENRIPACDQPLRVQRFDSFADLTSYREEWDQVALQSGADLFASFDWCSIWWKHFGQHRKPEILVIRSGDRVVACVPLFRESIGYGPWRIHVVRLAGSCDVGTRSDLAVHPQYHAEVMAAVARYINESGPWDVIHLGDLPGDFPHGSSIVEGLRNSLPQSQIVYRNGYFPNSVFDIPRSFEQYLDGLSSNERSAIRRTRRRLQEHPALQIHPVDAESFEEDFDHFLSQHESWWARSGRLGFFADWPGSAEFHREVGLKLACDGRLHFLKIEANGDPIAYNYSYRFGSRIHWFSGSRTTDSSWDAFSLGRQLHCTLVQQAIENGVSLIDGLSGHYDYKLRWGARSNQLKNITVMSPSLLSRLVVRDVASAARLDYILKRIWFWHLAPWIRRQLPRVQVSWLKRGQPRSFVRARFLEYATATRARDALCYG